jgi:methyl-accepting chemotaxis protein
MKYLNTLKFRLMVILLCVALIPLISMALFQYNQFDTTVNNNIRTQEIGLADTNADKIESWLSSKASQLTECLKAHPEFKKGDLESIRPIIKYID